MTEQDAKWYTVQVKVLLTPKQAERVRLQGMRKIRQAIRGLLHPYPDMPLTFADEVLLEDK